MGHTNSRIHSEKTSSSSLSGFNSIKNQQKKRKSTFSLSSSSSSQQRKTKYEFVPPPPLDDKVIVHVKNSFKVNANQWQVLLDEFYNPYFYNIVTDESTWSIPSILLGKPPVENSEYVTANVIIPPGLKSGDIFLKEIYSQQVKVTCPKNTKPGTTIELRFPIVVMDKYENNYDINRNNDTSYDDSYIDNIVEDNDNEEEYDDDNNNDDDNDDDEEDNEDDEDTDHDDTLKKIPSFVRVKSLKSVRSVRSLTNNNNNNTEVKVEERPKREHNSKAAWIMLAEEACIDPSLILRDVNLAKDIVLQVSQGQTISELIFQLTWSYRLIQLDRAVIECYIVYGNFLDSSPYDNCDGVPRYSSHGLVEWWEDLRAQRDVLEDKLETNERDRLFGDPTFFRSKDNDYSILQSSLLNSTDDASVLLELIDRKKKVELEIDNNISRILAIVSMEGPPTPPSKEALDNIHMYLSEQIISSTLDTSDLMEEIEEFLANALEPRHKFVVDIILNLCLLEFELQSLLENIDNWKPPEKEKVILTDVNNDQNGSDNENSNGDADKNNDENGESSSGSIVDDNGVGKTEEMVNAVDTDGTDKHSSSTSDSALSHDANDGVNEDSNSDDKLKIAPTNDTETMLDDENNNNNNTNSSNGDIDIDNDIKNVIQNLLLNQSIAYNQLQETLAINKENHRKLLLEKLEKQKLERKQQLLLSSISDVSSGNDLNNNVNDMNEKIDEIVENELNMEILNSMEIFDNNSKEKLKEFNLKCLEEMKLCSESESMKLTSLLQYEKDKSMERLKARLEKKKIVKRNEILENNHNNNVELTTIEVENIINDEYMKIIQDHNDEELQINNTFIKKLNDTKIILLNEVKSQYDVFTQQANDQLLVDKEKSIRALKNRLNLKLKQKMITLEHDNDHNKENNDDSNIKTQADIIAECKLEFKQIETEEMKKIDDNYNKDIEISSDSIITSLKDIHDKEVRKLDEILKHQEDLSKKSLHDRLLQRKQQKEIYINNLNDNKEKIEEIKLQLIKEEEDMVNDFNKMLIDMKNNFEKDEDKLQNILLNDKLNQSKSLQDRLLLKRKEKIIQNNNNDASATSNTNDVIIDNNSSSISSSSNNSNNHNNKDGDNDDRDDNNIKVIEEIKPEVIVLTPLSTIVSRLKSDQQYELKRVNGLVDTEKSNIINMINEVVRIDYFKSIGKFIIVIFMMATILMMLVMMVMMITMMMMTTMIMMLTMFMTMMVLIAVMVA